VRECVLDASVVLKWFRAQDEEHLEEAHQVRSRFESGQLRVLAPALLWLEALNVAARQWHWSTEDLEQLADTLPALGIVIVDPELSAIARWAGRGLTAYDAAYVALAEQTSTQLITDDARLVSQAPGLAVALAEQASGDETEAERGED
jgi:predicted nucleic acid-binding protein